MTDVFISYSRKNSTFARQLIDRLTRAQKDSWIDWEGIPLTAPNWWAEIKAGIAGADSFIFIMSPDSMASVVCNMELDYAIELNKRIIPVVYREIETRDAFASIADFEPDAAMEERLAGKDPLLIARDNWQRLSHINWVFFREGDDFDEAFDKLVATVETDLEYVKAHTRYLTRAQEWEREGRRSDLLLFGEEIERAEAWLTQGEHYAAAAETTAHDEKIDVVNPLPDDLHRAYIRESRRAQTRRQRIANTTRVSIAALIVALIVGGVIAFGIISQAQQSVAAGQATLNAVGTEVAQAENNITSLELAQRAANLRDNGAMLEALAVALAANAQPAPPPFAQRVLADISYNGGLRRRFAGHSDAVFSVAFSPDGQRLLSGSCGRRDENGPSCVEGEMILWDVATGERLRTFAGHTDRVNSVAFSPDGQRLLSG
ncbi:MAG: TIR domain-containing protein, partial [Chloroflexi bacterium]